MKTDHISKSLSPLMISMRMFGQYFTSKLYLNLDAVGDINHHCIKRCQTWNAGRIYATFLLVVTWLNVVWYCSVFNRKDTVIGADLFLNLGVITNAFLNAFLRSTYYVASHTGSLDRVFHQSDLCAPNAAPKYNCKAKVATIICWSLVSSNVMYYIYSVCNSGQYDDFPTLIFTKTYPLLKNTYIINIKKSSLYRTSSGIFSCLVVSSSNELYGDHFPV